MAEHRIRILKVTQSYEPFLERGGAAVKVPALARRLAERGHAITVLTADLRRRAPRGWSDYRDGIETVYLRTVARWRSLTVNPGVFAFCRRRLNEFDIVHIYGLYDLLGPAVAWFCWRRGLPYVVEPMGMTRPIVRSIRLKRFYHRAAGRRLLVRAQRVIATSEQERRELLEAGLPEGSVVVRGNGVERPELLPERGSFRRQWGIAEEAKMVLFLGRLAPKKSPEMLIRILARRIPASGPASEVLVIAGPEDVPGYGKRLEALSGALGLNGRVVFTGPLWGEQKWAAYRDADVFALPSQNENFGNAVAEAIACGTPVLITDRCGIAPLVEGRAGLVAPYDAGALETSLSRLLEDENLSNRLRSGCRQLRSSLGWEEPVRQVEELYRTMVL